MSDIVIDTDNGGNVDTANGTTIRPMSDTLISSMSDTLISPMKGRFAPSPTGHLHLGNLWIAMLSWLQVKQQQGTLFCAWKISTYSALKDSMGKIYWMI